MTRAHVFTASIWEKSNMASTLKRLALKPISHVLSDKLGGRVTRVFSGSLRDQICGAVTDRFLELLLGGMDLAFCLSSSYRKNIQDFRATYAFRTEDGLVSASAALARGNMVVLKKATDDWDTRVTFKDAAALRRFIFSKDQDILDSLLRNEVEVDGNLNLLYKFGFMARDLARRLGV
jgi:hypothetical protein